MIPSKIENEEYQFKKVGELSDGSAFGELALLKDQPRSASIYCLTDCHFAVLNKVDYLRILGKAENKKLDELIEFLKGIPIFANLSRKKLEKLTYFFNVVEFKRKQIVFHEGDLAKHVYIVKKGEFELKKQIDVENGRYNKQHINVKVALLARGEVFGEKEVILKQNCSVECTCYSTTGELLCITAENFLLKFNKNSKSSEMLQNRKQKYKNREERLSNFQVLFKSGQLIKEETSSQNNKIVTNPYYKKKSSVSGLSKSWKYSPLTKRNLENIKKNAFGHTKVHKVYVGIYTPLDKSLFDQDYDSIILKTEDGRYSSDMISHRPGGFYRARLKKPASHSRASSNLM